ncbi:hypothetical protein HON52_03710 [Candidatus Uhrbacteria bacterium]|jgi:hypothetical protein|nr:hypothetical protein [Candidatus Uhrbacteria bacterium]
MILYEIFPNAIAATLSLVAIIMLFKFAQKMKGGKLSEVINYLVVGILFSVTIHAVFELLHAMELISAEALLPIMGALLSIGSVSFLIAGYKGLKALK